MSLISVANAKLYTDKFGIIREQTALQAGTSSGNAVAGTNRNRVANLVYQIINGFLDIDQTIDLGSPANVLQSNVQAYLAGHKKCLQALDSHCQLHGASVASGLATFTDFLNYYNGVSVANVAGGATGAAKFSSMMHPSMGLLYSELIGVALPAAGLFHPGIHPDLDVASYPNGFATVTYASVLTAGADVNTTLYSEPEPFIEVITDFSGGGAAPTVVVSGTDDTGVLTTTWSATIPGGNNPTAAISTTFNGAQAADTKGSILVASSTGIVAGSIVTLSPGTLRQEVCRVLAVADGTHITVEMRNAHNSGDTITCKRAVALTPSVGSRRIRHVSAVAVTISSHSTGALRVYGAQERMGNPSNT